jgi:Fe-S-cluster-containing dehydrogenase component
MSDKDEKEKTKRSLSRRDFIKNAGAVVGGTAIGSAFLLSACGQDKETTKTVTNTLPGSTVTTTVPGSTITNTQTVTTTVTEHPTIPPAIINQGAWKPDAKYMIVQDSTTCVACRRCELACTEYNLGKSSPSLSNIKVSRNINFGPGGMNSISMSNSHGVLGDGRIVAETCLQCPHPVPCVTACPQGAIEITGDWNTRVINEEKCIGCGICTRACPWGMVSLDYETQKARKCDLCGGDPECVRVCPTGSLKLMTWSNRTHQTPPVASIPEFVASYTEKGCNTCHG